MILDHFIALILTTGLGMAPPAKPALPVLRAATADTVVRADTTIVPLTEDALKRMALFWELLAKESLAVRDTGFAANQEEINIKFFYGNQICSNTYDVVNMIALAKKYPVVSADLARAGLTAPQWELYRSALASASNTAFNTKNRNKLADSVDTASVFWKNVTLVKANGKLLGRIQEAGRFYGDNFFLGGGMNPQKRNDD